MAASIHTVNRHPVGPELVGSRNYVPMEFAHRQESTGTGPVFLKIARVPGAAYTGSTIRTNFCAPLFPHNDHWYCTKVNMCDTNKTVMEAGNTLRCLCNVSAIIRCLQEGNKVVLKLILFFFCTQLASSRERVKKLLPYGIQKRIAEKVKKKCSH